MLSASLNYTKFPGFWPYAAVLVCLLVMLPRLLAPQFSLLDDGRSLNVAESIANGKWDLSWDLHSGRSRPLHWLGFAFWYLLVGGKPFWYYFGTLVVFSLTTFILIRLVLELGGSRLQAFASGVFFALSGPIIEDIYALSKDDNLRLLLLSFVILLAIRAAKDYSRARLAAAFAVLTALILAACLAKETALAMIPTSLGWWFSLRIGRRLSLPVQPFAEKAARLQVLASVTGGGLYYLGRAIFVTPQLTGVGYTSNYNFQPGFILNNLVRWGGWLVRDYVWAVPLALVVGTYYLAYRRWPASWIWWFAFVWMVIELGVYIPWYFVADYYLMPFAAGAALLIGFLFVESLKLLSNAARAWRTTAAAALVVSAALFAGSLANNAASASVILAQDDANAGVLKFIAENAPNRSAVIVNIQLWNEYIEGMDLMLRDFYDRPDIQFDYYQQQDLSKLTRQYPAVFVLVPELENQPLMTVRMGLNEPTQRQWNSSLLPLLDDSWQVVYQVGRQPRLLTVDFPRLLCTVVYRENYCRGGGLVKSRTFHYQWTVYQSQN